MKEEIIKKFKSKYKDSSLFNSWDDCEKELTEFIGKVYDVAYNLGWKEKAEQMLRAMKDYVSSKNYKGH